MAVSPEDDGGRRYNDGQWHHVIATRTQAVGTITVDGQYRGNSRHGSHAVILFTGRPQTLSVLSISLNPSFRTFRGKELSRLIFVIRCVIGIIRLRSISSPELAFQLTEQVFPSWDPGGLVFSHAL